MPPGGRQDAVPGAQRRASLRADAPESRALDRLVELQRVAPERLVAEGVEPKDLQALLELLASIVANGVVADPMWPLTRLSVGGIHPGPQNGQGGGPVHRARVEIPRRESTRERARHRGFSGAGWSIDRDDALEAHPRWRFGLGGQACF